MADIFEDEINDALEPAEEQQEQLEDWIEEAGTGLPPLDTAAAEEEDVYDPEADLEQPEPEPAPRQSVQDRRAALQQLVKKTAGGGSDGSKKAKKGKKEKSGDKQQEQQRSSRPKRSRQAAEPEEAGSKRPRAFDEPELPEGAYVETAEDQDFIDDDGVPEDERYEGDDLEVLAQAEEAEEAAPGEEEDGPMNLIDEVIKARKRRRKADEQQIWKHAEQLVAQMLASAKSDLVTIEGSVKKPAVAKFQALKHVDELLRQRSHHEAFIQLGGLAAIGHWLRPYPNGALPLLQIRSTLVDLLQLMNLDTSNEYTREKLQESELGKIVMFYEKNPHEKSMSLKTKCRDLVLAWSAPIFANATAETNKRRRREREHRQRMGRDKETRAETERRELEAAEKRRKAREGEEGFRTRAAVPQPSKLDFVINPGCRSDDGPRAPIQPGAKAGGGGGKPKSPMPEALQKALAAKKRGNRDRFGGMSVEGRGLIV